MCLRFTQTVWGAPVQYATAWESWINNPDKHTDELPPVPCLVWFSHYGTYNGVYGNFGHVVTYVPGRGFLSSPGQGYGQEWFLTIDQIERTFTGKFVGWTTSINGLIVAEYKTDPQPTERVKDMRVLAAGKNNFLVGKGFISIAADMETVRIWNDLWGATVPIMNGHDWNRATWGLGIPVGTQEVLASRYVGKIGCWEHGRGYYLGETGNA
jgi:hypothetical protein